MKKKSWLIQLHHAPMKWKWTLITTSKCGEIDTKDVTKRAKKMLNYVRGKWAPDYAQEVGATSLSSENGS